MTVNFSKDKFNLREKLKELERPSVDKLITKDENGAYIDIIRGNTKLENINSVKSDTATDVFVYDTSKDSDGGAWRKRTQNTSWYNETLGTATRGTRKEFPAVAVIVLTGDASTSQATIYDGDDPDLPMWMVIPDQTIDWASNGGAPTATAALNAKICITCAGSGIVTFDFIEDLREIYYTGNFTFNDSSIINRASSSYRAGSINGVIVNNQTNDVAMTVLPNAPIDDATGGLPVPTIAVATDGGTSVIKDDGTVVDFNDALGSTRPVSTVVIRGNDIVHWNVNNGTIQQFFDALIATADSTDDVKYNYTANGGHATCENVSALLRESGNGPYHIVTRDSKSIAAGAQSGMSVFVDGTTRSFSTNNPSIFDSRVAYITSDYNTGYMPGDIKGAFLSDTDTSSIGTELITNGTFDSDITGWITNPFNASYPGSVTWDSGTSTIKVSNPYGTSLLCGIQQTLTNLISGRQYVVTFDVTTGTTNGQYIQVAGQDIGYSGEGTYSIYFTPNSSSYGLDFGSRRPGYGIVTYYDNISVKLAEADRSLNKNGLAVYGTITKTPVATGADLVAYSGFTLINYLRQFYNSDFDFGTGDFCVALWTKRSNVSTQVILEKGNGTSNRLYLYISASNDIRFSCGGQGTSIYGSLSDTSWHQIVIVRRSGTVHGYVNGNATSVTSNAQTVTGSTDDELFIGKTVSSQYPYSGSIALVRISGSAPSAEQIKKMYEDEKVLFHENAKATLYGSSDAVTALAYDEVTDQLHVGTSAGRSDFEGLRRINNTTTAVTTAISAHDEFIIEQ